MLRRLAPFAADLWTNRELLWQFTLRNVELRHKGSHLGLVWSFLNPLLMLGLYVLVFGYIFGGSSGILPNETKIDYALGVFMGLTLFPLCGRGAWRISHLHRFKSEHREESRFPF